MSQVYRWGAAVKEGAVGHKKTLRLAKLLGVEAWAANGLVDAFLQWVSAYAPTGALGDTESFVVADYVRWKGDPDDLIRVLIDAGWLRRHGNPKFGVVVCNWMEHAPGYIKRKLLRNGLTFWESGDASVTTQNETSDASVANPQCPSDASVTDQQPTPGPQVTDPRRVSDRPHTRARPIQSNPIQSNQGVTTTQDHLGQHPDGLEALHDPPVLASLESGEETGGGPPGQPPNLNGQAERLFESPVNGRMVDRRTFDREVAEHAERSIATIAKRRRIAGG